MTPIPSFSMSVVVAGIPIITHSRTWMSACSAGHAAPAMAQGAKDRPRRALQTSATPLARNAMPMSAMKWNSRWFGDGLCTTPAAHCAGSASMNSPLAA
jgi:hypothetical protein